MGLKNNASSRSGGAMIAATTRAFFRLLQFIMALAVVGLYGTDLNAARMSNTTADPRWIYAETIAGLSAITSLIYMIPLVKSYLGFGWDTLLFILWVAVFGTFGKLYINADPAGDDNIQRMKNAVWVDLFNLFLWFFSAIYGAITFFRSSHRPSSMPTVTV
ncbi:MAG: hypothetical protein M1838_005897 [Thelocarpon superellum]|nr:MAG: hypothetical protein M1838_005897 [Thelocarpon superellum]